MSRIGKKQITIPANVKVSLKESTVTVQGPQGTLALTHRPDVRVAWDEGEKAIAVTIDPAKADNAETRASWGTTRALIQNMVDGVTKGYEKSLEVVGVGWSAALQGTKLKLVVGYANPILMEIPKGLKVTVEKQIVRVSGPDKKMVGQFAADMRAKRKPEPYNGKGIKYTDEVIKRKAGKQFGS